MENLQIKVLRELDTELTKQINYLDNLCFPKEHWTQEQKTLYHDKFGTNDRFAYVIAYISKQLVGNIWLFK